MKKITKTFFLILALVACLGFTIVAEAASTTTQQVRTNGIKGDLNQDGRVDKSDLDIMGGILVQRITATQVHKQVGDLNNDGSLDVTDLSQLQALIKQGGQPRMLQIVYPANGLYSIQPMCAPNMELTVEGASTAEGSNVFIYSINSHAHTQPSHQKWYIERIGNTEWYKITAENSGHALNIHGGVPANGTNVSVWPYSPTASHHQFRFLDAGNGYYVLQGHISGNFVLDVKNAGNANGTNVQMQTYNSNGSSAQRWKLVRRNPAPQITEWRIPVNSDDKNYFKWGGRRSRDGKLHVGADYFCNDYKALAVASGTVYKTGYQKANGNYIIIKHRLDGRDVYSFYGHLAGYYVRAGQAVKAGDVIGKIGATGTGSNGITHIHFALTSVPSNTGGYYGYLYFNANNNKTAYQNGYFYNPVYVFKNKHLP